MLHSLCLEMAYILIPVLHGYHNVKSYPLQINLHVKNMWFGYNHRNKQYQIVYLWEI